MQVKIKVLYNIYIRFLHSDLVQIIEFQIETHIEKQMLLTVTHSVYMLCAQNALEWM
jgi:hypothetical protein